MWKSPFYECISVRVVVMKKLSSCKGIIAVILFSLIMICFAGCHLWYQDLKGYLEHWSDTVSVKGMEWSASPESQKNSSGVDTVATNATISASVAISNPENYALNYEIGTSSDPLKSVRLTGATAVLSSARIISSSPSSIQVQIAPLSAVPTPESLALEHSDFTLQFIPVRSDSGLAAPTAESITLRYNTPPRMPLEVVYNKDSKQLDWMGSEGWKLVQQAHDSHLDNHIYWAWPRGITDPRHPDYVTKFQIYVDGILSQEGAPDNFKYTDSAFISPKLADYQVYRVVGTSGSKIEIYAVDPEDVTSFATGSGIAPHKITLTTDQGFFSSSGVDNLEVYKAAGSLAIGSDFEAPYNSDTEYYLSGWTCDGNPVSFPLEINKPMELVAQWTAYPVEGGASSGSGGTPGGDSEGTTGSGSASSSTVSITYDANGADSGTVPASQNKLAGKTVTLAKNSGNLTKEHHTFSGWNTQADGKGQFYGEGTTYATDDNVTLYAQWTKWNQVEPVQFNVGSGNVKFNTLVTISTATPNATIHYTVNGSGEQIGAEGQPVVITITSDATISAYATYDGMIPSTETSANYKLYTYTITYDGNGADGGNVPGQQTFSSGSSVTVASAGTMTKTGYTFNGWNTQADGAGTSYAEGSSFADDADLTLYAQWKANTYTVTFSGGTGGSATVTVTYDQTPPQITPPSPPTTGFSFKSYNTQKDGTGIDYYDGNGVGVGTWQESNNTTLYAQWDYEEPSKASDGTTYQISNAGNLLWISEALMAETITKFNIELTADIVVPEGEWKTINVPDGNSCTFDGQGHSITLNGATEGLFWRYNYSTVKNLVLKGSITASDLVGAIGATMYSSTIENVMSEVTVSGPERTGGLVGQFGGRRDNPAIIRNCAVYADVKGGTETGGLVGLIWKGGNIAIIENSIYVGTVSGGTPGAIVGQNGSNNGYISILNNIYYCELSEHELGSIGFSENTNNVSITNVVSKTADEIKNNGVSILGSAWELKTGASYPTLK